MDLGDLRRLAGTVFFAMVLALGWVWTLWLVDRGDLAWIFAEAALRQAKFSSWMAGTAAVLGLFILLLALGTLGVTKPNKGASRHIRQLQCQACKAVFQVQDTGARPLVHPCPNCRALGVYDGKQPAVGEPPKSRRVTEVLELGLNCRTCHHHFVVRDTGVRPLRIQCPKCKAAGQVY